MSHMDRRIEEKKSAVRHDAFEAKQRFDLAKSSLESMAMHHDEDDRAFFQAVDQLRHEIKLLMALINQARFDEILQLMSAPIRLMGINFMIGLIRGFGFALAVIIILIVVFISFSDAPIAYLFL